MHPRTTAVLLATAGLLALTGCSSSSHDKTPPATTAAATTPAAPAATSSAPTTYQLGQPYHWSDAGTSDTGTTTVLAYKQPVHTANEPGPDLGVPPGSAWGRIDIRVCLTSGDPIHVTQEPWHVQFKDGSQADVTGLFGGDMPKPEFPQDRTLTAGQCARGGIMFPIPKGQRPVEVAYSPESIPTPTYWTIPAK